MSNDFPRPEIARPSRGNVQQNAELCNCQSNLGCRHHLFVIPSRPGAVSRPRPLSEPYVTVSRHTAQALHKASVAEGRPGCSVSAAWSDRTAGLEWMQPRPAASGPTAEVFVLDAVVGVCRSLDLHVPDDAHASGSLKVDDSPWSRFPFDGREELP